MKTKVYIAGPITGMPDDNRAAFAEAAEIIRSLGLDPVNPLDGIEELKDPSYVDYICRGLRLLDGCDAMFLLEGWHRSPGARIEFEFARREGKRISYQAEGKPIAIGITTDKNK